MQTTETNNSDTTKQSLEITQHQAVLNSAQNFKLLNSSTVSKSITLLADVTLSAVSSEKSVEKSLNDDEPDSKRACLNVDSSTASSSPRGIFVVEKVPLEQASVELLIRQCSSEQLHKVFRNDIYSAHLIVPPCLASDSAKTEENTDKNPSTQKTTSPDANAAFTLKLTSICPATEQHIAKYSAVRSLVVIETRELYDSRVRQHIERVELPRLKWVANILEGRQEQDRIVYRHPVPVPVAPQPQSGETAAASSDSSLSLSESAAPPPAAHDFLIVEDMKWDGRTIASLYVLAIAYDPKLQSLRDLRGEHLPLLRAMLDEGLNAVAQRFNVDRRQLLAFMHYPPSFYQMHVHIVLLGGTALAGGALGAAGSRSHLLPDVISTLETAPNFYARASLALVLRESDPLVALLSEPNAPPLPPLTLPAAATATAAAPNADH